MDSPVPKPEFEKITQELYSAKNTMETLACNLRNAEEEIVELKRDLLQESEARSEVEEIMKSRNSLITTNRLQITGLQDELEKAGIKEKEAADRITDLEDLVKKLRINESEKIVHPNPSFDEEDEKEMYRLQERLTLLEEEQISLQLKVESLSSELEGKTRELVHLRQELEEKETEVECLESQFEAQCNITESQREELRALKDQLETEEGSQVSLERKGNSLFAEVEDRRIAAEKHVVGVVSKLSHVEERLTKSQEENKRLKKQMVVLRQSATKGYDSGVVRDLQTQLKDSKVKVIEVTEKLHKERKAHRTKTKKDINTPFLEGLKEDHKAFVNYLQVMNDDKDKQMKELQSTAESEHIQKLHTDLRLTQVSDQLTAATRERESLKMANTELRMEIRELQLQYEPEQVVDLGKVTFESAQKSSVPLSEKNDDTTSNATAKCQIQTNTSKSSSKSSSSMKENDPLEMISRILSSGAKTTKGKSVQMVDTVNVMGEDGLVKESQLDISEKSGKKLKPSASKSGSSKFRSVTKCATSEESPGDCKQQ